MNYIDPVNYSKLLNKFAKGTQKGMLKESYIDLVPLNHLNEYTEEGEIETEGNAFTAALAKTPKGGEFKVDGETMKDTSNYDASVKEGKRDLSRLSPDEQKQLKEYINSIKEIKGAIQELVAKATVMEGGDTTGLTMTPEGEKEGPGMSDEEAEDLIAKHEKEEKDREDYEASIH